MRVIGVGERYFIQERLKHKIYCQYRELNLKMRKRAMKRPKEKKSKKEVTENDE